MLRCQGGSLYTGITTDLARRLSEHIGKTGQGAKYTRSHPATDLEAAFLAEDLRVAAKYEYRIKHLSKEKKEGLVKDPGSIKTILSGLYREHPVKAVSKKKLSEFRIVFSAEK